LILEAILEGNNLRLLKENIGDFSGARLDLSRVLSAFIKKDYLDIKQSLNGNILSVNGFGWDLTEETLEEQSKETQRAINQLLKNENKS